MADGWLFVMMDRRFFWINLGVLLGLGKEEVVDWGSLSSPPFSDADVPETDEVQVKYHHFVFDSELYVAAGGLINPCKIVQYIDFRIIDVEGRGSIIGDYDFEQCLDKLPPCKIYRFDMEKSELTGAGPAISRPPTPFAPCFMGNISASGNGNVYLLVCYESHLPEGEGLWVLSSSGEWQPLSPPPLPSEIENYIDSHSFVFQDKLFFQVYLRERAEEEGPLMYSFDPSTTAWTPLAKDDMHLFTRYFREAMDEFCFPSVTMSRLSSNYSVALSWSLPDAPGREREIEVMIEALLVNNQNGAVILCQRLDDCLKGILPATFSMHASRFNFVDLGNGTVCALLYGYASNHDHPVLCISVFTLSVIEANIGTDTDAGTEATRKDFLFVSVHVKRVFTMKDYEYSWMLDSFIFTPKKEMLASKVLVE